MTSGITMAVPAVRLAPMITPLRFPKRSLIRRMNGKIAKVTTVPVIARIPSIFVAIALSLRQT